MDPIKNCIGLVWFCIFIMATLAGCSGPAALSEDMSGVTRPPWLDSRWNIMYSPQLHPEKTVEEAIAELEKDMTANGYAKNVWVIDETHKPASATYCLQRVTIDPDVMTIQGLNDVNCNSDSMGTTNIDIDLFELPRYPIYVVQTRWNTWNYEISMRDLVGFMFKNPADVRRIADNLFILQQSVNQQRESRLKNFKEQAAQYRALAVKPAISEEQRKFVVQANALSQLKDYTGAMRLYRKAIAVDPVSYPAAYFNLALLSAQIKRYDAAINSMQQYLLLMPDAQDARSAQDKIYEWEAMSQK